MVVLTILPSFVVVFQSPSRVWLFTTPRTVAHQASMSVIISWSLLRFMSLSWWCDPTISSSVTPFSFCPQSFPPSGPFLMSQLFASRGQSTGASASILPMNIQNWFALGLTGLISLQSEGLSRVFSNITVASQKASVYTHTHTFLGPGEEKVNYFSKTKWLGQGWGWWWEGLDCEFGPSYFQHVSLIWRLSHF